MRRKPVALVSVVLAAGIVLLGWSQPWFMVEIIDQSFELRGDVIAPALLALALVALALVAVLALAGPRLRLALALVVALAGAVVAALGIATTANPDPALVAAIAERTGVGGEAALDLVVSVGVTVWPIVSTAGGVLLGAVGIGIALNGSRWPAPTRRYDRGTRAQRSEGAVDVWDAQTAGDDPTDRDR